MDRCPSKAEAAAWTINNGTDLDMGDPVWGDPSGMLAAVTGGLVNETTIDRSVMRTLLSRLRAGEFDPKGQVEWLKLGAEAVGSNASSAINHEASLQGMVLLKNEVRKWGLKPNFYIDIQMIIFYHDRLGTNIGETTQKGPLSYRVSCCRSNRGQISP
jgi:beta-glucosidase-like glycosyl hydrolase